MPGNITHRADTSFGGQKKDLWLRYYLDADNPQTFMDKVESVFAAGYNYERDDHGYARARIMGSNMFRRCIPEIEAWLNEVGLSEARLKAKLSELLEAKETKFFADKGVVTDQREVVAHGVQVKALDMAFKVRGSYAPEKVDLRATVGMSPELREKLDEIKAGIKARAIQD